MINYTKMRAETNQLPNWTNEELKKAFIIFERYLKQGWKIELEQVDQLQTGYWKTRNGLPFPDQWNNYSSRIPLVTWSTYVYPPDSEDYVERLNASFNSPMEAYKWLAPLLVKYVNERRKDEEAQ